MLDYDSVLDSFINRNIKKEVLNIDDYEITYYRQKDCKDFVIFDNDDSLIHFQSREDLIQYIIEKVVNGKENYPDILFKGSNLLKDYTYGIAYHISSVSNREDILAKGLIPNGKSDLDTLPTSIYLDRYRIKSIPKNFYKSLSVYLYPEYYLSSTERTCANNIDLYGVDISGLDWMIGSQFLSGNCIVNCNILDNDIVTNEKNRIKEAKTYWKNCFSKEEYLSNSDRVIKSDKYWGLDEILYCGIIDTSRIKLIGTWSRDKCLWYFYDDNIKFFIKEDYLDNYKNTLRKINRNQELNQIIEKDSIIIEKEIFSLTEE